MESVESSPQFCRCMRANAASAIAKKRKVDKKRRATTYEQQREQGRQNEADVLRVISQRYKTRRVCQPNYELKKPLSQEEAEHAAGIDYGLKRRKAHRRGEKLGKKLKRAYMSNQRLLNTPLG